MSMPADIAEKFQSLIDDWMTGISTIADNIFGPGDNEDKPFVQSNVFFAHCLFRTPQGYYLNTSSGISLYWSIDVELEDNDIKFGNLTYLGKDNNAWSDAAIAEMQAAVKEEYFYVTTDDTGELYVRLSGDAGFTLYSGGVYYNNKVHFHCDNPDSYYHATVTNGFGVRMGQCTYTIDAQGRCVTNLSYAQSHPSNSNNLLYSINTYPIVGNIKDTTYINSFIGAQGATNNYQTTYTTQGGYSFKVYYGDNYIITNAVGDNVSYNDIKNAVQVAVTQINDDNDTDMNVPDYPTPPEPSTDDDDYVDMGLGVETDGMAMYNMAVITRDDLIQLITDFESNADTGLSFIPHVLGLYKLGIESSQLLTTKSEQIKLHKEPNGTSAFTSADNYNIVENQLTVIDCGSITVDREELLTNTFYDYSPYSTYEMFIPGCGWITLPDTVVGRTISVSIVFDLTTCSCKGVVRSEGQLLGGSGTTLATVNGIIGSSVPLSINETGLQRAAIFNGSTQAAMALGTAFLGAGIGNPYMGASGVAMAAGALADNHVAGNTTYTNTKGGATDYSVFGDGYKAVLKITRPVVEIPDNYGHTVGFVVNEYGMLSDFHGFTVCVNPHIHISATSDEKEEIKRLLESGVILPDGE